MSAGCRWQILAFDWLSVAAGFLCTPREPDYLEDKLGWNRWMRHGVSRLQRLLITCDFVLNQPHYCHIQCFHHEGLQMSLYVTFSLLCWMPNKGFFFVLEAELFWHKSGRRSRYCCALELQISAHLERANTDAEEIWGNHDILNLTGSTLRKLCEAEKESLLIKGQTGRETRQIWKVGF